MITKKIPRRKPQQGIKFFAESIALVVHMPQADILRAGNVIERVDIIRHDVDAPPVKQWQYAGLSYGRAEDFTSPESVKETVVAR